MPRNPRIARSRKQVTAAQVARRERRTLAGREGLTGRAAELARGYAPQKPIVIPRSGRYEITTGHGLR